MSYKSFIKYDFILDLDVTSPLRTFEDIENALNIILENDNIIIKLATPYINNTPLKLIKSVFDSIFNVVR